MANISGSSTQDTAESHRQNANGAGTRLRGLAPSTGNAPTTQTAVVAPSQPTPRSAALAAIWNRHLPGTRDRVAQLDRAAALAADGLLTAPLRSDAAMAAHKLAGSLGTFGYHEGTTIARAIEQLLDAPEPPHAANLLRLTAELRAVLPL